MRIKTKKVYYCDFCKKHSLKSLLKHELHCTGNLNRQCGVCGNQPNYKEIIDKLKTRYYIKTETMWGCETNIISWNGEVITLDEIMDLVEGCPACTLTIIRHIDFMYMNIGFDYKKELKCWWELKNWLKSQSNYEN